MPENEEFESNLNVEDITYADYKQPERVWKNFKVKNLGKYYDLYIHCDTLLLAAVFEGFRNKCIEIYVHFLSSPGLAWQACLKKTEVKLELLTDIDMLLKIKKGTRGGICHAIHRYAAANNTYMNNYDIIIIIIVSQYHNYHHIFSLQ